jgi:murein DD-endopeptidase MepM/ murein hydrolase activator NlpD
MASNKFFTLMVVPEKSQKVAKIVIPSYVFKGGILSLVFLGVLATIMVLDYANVMNQINENKQLKVENRQLRQSVQVFKTKLVTIENTMDRVKTFVTKLRIITNVDATGGSNPATPTLPSQPNTNPPAPGSPNTTQVNPTQPIQPVSAVSEPTPEHADRIDRDTDVQANDPNAARVKRLNLLALAMNSSSEVFTLTDADTSLFVKNEFERLDSAYEEVNKFALATEQETQDTLEKLGEKRILLAGTPTLLPTRGGYISSRYGIRPSPFDGINKMHEGIDIANQYGADIIAPADGVVTFAGVRSGYGKLVVLDHGNGLETRYAHNSRFFVNAGDRVHRGQKLAAVGNTGHSTGPHCHYEVHANGVPVDPCVYILDLHGDTRGGCGR